MYHQYLNQATSALAYLSTDELKQLVEDESDEKLEERINDVVNRKKYASKYFALSIVMHRHTYTLGHPN